MSIPLFSIITPCLNRAEFIIEAVESVLAQNYRNFEHIIIDGGSTDGTLELLKHYPHLQVQSGPDLGMYDALNKGLKFSKGEIIGFLNSDDLYVEDAFASAAEELQKQNTLALAGGASVFTMLPDGRKHVVSTYYPQGPSLLEIATIGDPYFNAWFFRRSVFESISGFNVDYKIVADREFILRLALSNLPYGTINKIVYQYRSHPSSMTFDITYEKLQRIIDEHISMTSDYLQKGDLPTEARNLIKRLRTRDTAEMALRSLQKGRFDNFSYYSQRGSEYNSLWLLNFTRRIIDHIRYG